MARKTQTQTPEEIEANTAKFFDDLEALRLSPEDTAGLGSKKLLTTVPVRKPRKLEYFRCHPDPAMTLTAMLVVDDDDNEAYFVAPDMRSYGDLADSVKPSLLQLCITRNGTLFIWPLTLPNVEGGGGRGRSWHESGLKARKIAMAKWIRIVSSRELGGYQPREAEGKLDEPSWPEDITFNEILELAFADKIIVTEDHPFIRKLRGLV